MMAPKRKLGLFHGQPPASDVPKPLKTSASPEIKIFSYEKFRFASKDEL